MPNYVAELIDQAVSDASVGPDAVRCIPEPLAIPVAEGEDDLEALSPPVIDLVEAFVVFDEHHVWRPEVEAAPAGAVVFAWRDRKCIYVVREPLLVPPGVNAYVGYEAPLH
jgi:hypothetical protein